MVFLTGDVHGGADLGKLKDWSLGDSLTKEDYLIVCGDFGYPWDFSLDECDDINWIETRPWTTLFVDGNHERFDHWTERPCEEWHGGLVKRLSPDSSIRRLLRGQAFDLGGKTFFTMGGASSVDRDMRIEGVSWWPCELPSEGNFAEARRRLDEVGWKIDFVVTHDCSARMLPAVLGFGVGCTDPMVDRLNRFLDELEDRLTFSHWYFGHHHLDFDLDDRHTVLYQEVVSAGSGVDFA